MYKTELPLIESLETFKDFFDNAYDLVHIVQLDGSIIYINKAWQRQLEYSLEEVHGVNILEFVAPADQQRFRDYRQKIIAGDIYDATIVIQLVARSGRLLPVEGIVSARINEHKQSYTRGIFRDITVRLHNEQQLLLINEQLKEREANLRQLLLHAPDAVIVIDDKSIITFWNPMAATMFGWTDQEAVGRHLGDTIVPPQYKVAHQNGMDRYLATGSSHILNTTIQITAVNKDGKEFYVALTLSATSQNNKPAFIGFIRNIDHEKRIELELKNKRIELELSNKKLEQFAFITSHDLQEPLRKISFFTDLVLTRFTIEEAAAKYLEKVNEAARRMSFLIKGLLGLSRLGHKNIVFEPTDLNHVVSNVLADFELLIQQKKAVIRTETLPLIEAIPIQMNQLFFNLLGNSLKFTRRNVAPEIKMSVQRYTPQGSDTRMTFVPGKDYYEITFQDNGIGFSQVYADKIFDIFQQLNERSQFEGYGIGLAVCQKIVENHGGLIWANSNPAQGATFHVILPAAHEPAT